MVEIDIGPVERCVAGVTGGGKSGGDMARIGGSIPVGLMATVAVGRERGVVIVDVALGAGHGRMSTGEGKDRRVIECRCVPGGGCVTQGTVGWETSSNVRGICGAVEVDLVAGIAGCRR